MGIGVFIIFVTTSAGMLLIKPPAICAAFMVLQLYAGAALLTDPPEKPEPKEKTELVESVD